MLQVLSFAHQTTPLMLRERLTLAMDAYASAYATGKSMLTELCLLHTCGRTTLIFVGEKTAALTWIQMVYGIDVEESRSCSTYLTATDALTHLMQLACGLESAILGEPQILGQLKTAYAKAQQYDGIGLILQRVMPAVFRAAKAVRTDTRIGCSPLALARVVFDLAKRVFDDMQAVRLCLIGAGETIEQHMAYAQSLGIATMHVVNRSLDRAERLVATHGGQVHPLSQLPEVLCQVDCVISATANPLPLVGKGLMERIAVKRCFRPMLCVDLAMPRDIEPEVTSIEGVYLYNIEDLHRQIAAHQKQRRAQVSDAQTMIARHVDRTENNLQMLAHISAIRNFRAHIEQTRDQSMQEALADLAKGEAPACVLERALYQLAQKVMHQPTKQLRKAAQQQNLDVLDCAAQLFAEEGE